jgi:hypothetical protein
METISGAGDAAVAGLGNPKDAKKLSKERGIASCNACRCVLNLVELTPIPTTGGSENAREAAAPAVLAVYDLQAAL